MSRVTQERELDRGLPASIDAERAILGAVLLDNNAMPQALESVDSEDFSLDSHRRIFARMQELHDTDQAIDFVTLTECLSQHKEVESVGGVAYVTSLTDGLPRVKNIEQYCHLVRDKAMLRDLIHATTSIQAQAYAQEEIANSIVEAAESAILQISDHRIRQGLKTTQQVMEQSFGSIDNLYQQGQHVTGVRTYFDDFDTMTGGLQKKELIIVAARPSMGKSCLCGNIAENASIKDDKHVAIFSLEMSAESLLKRMFCSQGMVDATKLRNGFMSHGDLDRLAEGAAKVLHAPISIDDTPGITVSEMRAKCRRYKQATGHLDLVIVDYVQLVGAAVVAAGKRAESRTQEVAAISRSLKSMAKYLDCPVVALSQLSRFVERRGENKRPMLSDLAESGQIEADADVVGFIFREELYRPDDVELQGKAELIIAKNRNGATGTVRLAFVNRCLHFSNLATDEPPSDYHSDYA